MAKEDAPKPGSTISLSLPKIAGTIKNIAIVLPIVAAIAIAFWKADIRAWLTEEIRQELEEPEFHDWHYTRVYDVFQGLDAHEIEAIKNQTQLRTIIREVLREELSGGELDGLNALEASHNNVIQAIMNPPAFESLEAIVTKRVDAIYTFELYDRRKLQVFFGEESDEATSALFQNVSVSDLTARFYAANDQQISISVQPNYGADWREAISNGTEAMLLKIGGQDVEIGLGPRELDITCDVRKGLGLRANGMVQVRAEPKSRTYDKTDGFQLDITIVARKGDRTC
ncbi:hypothetical protein [Aliiroseovarius marinus]|uniref:hypothetical protein n=1 Tax=Aliiroseovarius marinus TaxID=2500159 RepID=UPI002494EC93|nr:hypothetical protein [Aliiroseovarius marinus]